MAADRKSGDGITPSEWALRPRKVGEWVEKNSAHIRLLGIDSNRFLKGLTISTFTDTAPPFRITRLLLFDESNIASTREKIVPQQQINCEERIDWLLSTGQLPEIVQAALKAAYEALGKNDWLKDPKVFEESERRWARTKALFDFSLIREPELKKAADYYHQEYGKVGATVFASEKDTKG